ncbi:ABC transporter ATP-binding protein [[Clostridium] colinum]|uniref:ABC transporter ATP-binding protein n=1 Tax=[Clostridium] colinum TaxID=36835 RepID=UPI0020257A37|nr:ABC transporter ATP-binding protein [[Clostridium] colinum]
MTLNKKQIREKEREIKKFNKQKFKEYTKQKNRKNIPEEEYVTQMKNDKNLIEFDNLQTYFYTDAGTVKSVDGVSFDIPLGKTVGVVGESGCGKSVTSLSLMGLLPSPHGQIAGGEIRYNSKSLGKTVNLAKLPQNIHNKIRGGEISMIFQEPMTSLNPIFTIGKQIEEVIYYHEPQETKEGRKKRTLELLKSVGISRVEEIYKSYPHELSGGMRQRVVIAMSLACNPNFIVADEPTTALDVTIQAQILDLLRELKNKINASIMLITHDLGVVAEMADYVVIMYSGRVVEKGEVKEIFKNPKHPYTKGLLKSRPVLQEGTEKLYCIPGAVPNPINMPSGCFFKNRCENCIDICDTVYPNVIDISNTHKVACHLYSKREED